MTTSAQSPARSALRAGFALLLLLAAVPLGLVATALPAQACSCVMLGAQEEFENADAVFLGEVVAREGDRDAITYTIAVDRVFKGEVAPLQEVVSNGYEASCGIVLPDHGSVIIFGWSGHAMGVGRLEPGQYGTGLCTGSGRATTAPAVFGEGRPPGQEAPAPGTPDPGLVEGVAPVAASYAPWVAGGVVLVLLGGLTYALVTGRRRSG